MSRCAVLVRLLVAASVIFSITSAVAQERAVCGGNAAPQGVIVALDGTVEVLDEAGSAIPLSVGAVLCARDQITTGARSRIEFRLTGKDTTTGSSSNSVTVIPASQSECVELRSGLMSFISSVIGSHCVSTPLIDAGIDGTEALLAVDGQTGDSFVLVQEGIVSVRDRRGGAGQGGQFKLIAAGDDLQNSAFATQAQSLTRATPENIPPKFRELLLKQADATDWAIHYPPILFASGVTDPSVREAAVLLDAGEADAANALLLDTPLTGRDKAAALALRSIAAIYRNQIDLGSGLANDAIATDPNLSAGHIAQSYAYQASGQLDSARLSAEMAVSVEPSDAYGWARLAELHLTIGARRDARDAVGRSLAIAETALGRTIEGFAALSMNDFDAAEIALWRAVEIDSEAPLPRLGLGLKLIRQGDIAEGRLEIETAVALDPKRASLRTWLGRAYYEEGRGEKATAQYNIARDQDPDDPNAYFFDAVQFFDGNRPIEALRAVEYAQERSQGRSVVRSQQGLGEDRAVRGAALGRIYDNIGLEQLALAEGARAVDADPANPEAHRFLAGVFRTQPNSGIAQTSELLTANLLAPPSKTPIQPQLLETDIALLETAGPTRSTFDEFAGLFDANGVRVDASGFFGSQQTFGDEVSGALLYNDFSASFGQLYLSTDGYRENNDLEHKIFDAQLKFKPIDKLTLFGEYRRRETEAGDRDLDFVIHSGFDPTLRQSFNRELFRVGVHGELTARTDILAVATFGKVESFDETGMPLMIKDVENSTHFQARGIHRFDNATVIAGGSHTSTNSSSTVEITVIPPFGPPIPVVTGDARKIEQYGVYGYANLQPFENLELTFGGSYDVYDDGGTSGIGRHVKLNPKIGARLLLTDAIELRGAYTRTLKPRLISDQLIEPTSVMGFSQYLDVANGAVIDTLGVAIDAQLSDDIRAGVSVAAHRWASPVIASNDSLVTEDYLINGYVQKIFKNRWSLTGGIYHEYAESEASIDLSEFRLTSLPVSLRYFDPNGVFGAIKFEPVFHSFEDSGTNASSSFLMLNAAIGFRLPNNRGVISLEAQNLLDQEVRFQDRKFRRDSFSIPRFAPELTALAKISLRF